MGRITVPFGVKGWVKVKPDTETLDSLFDYPEWWVEMPAGWQAFELAEGQVHGDHLAVRLDGMLDRDDAFALKGRRIAVPRSAMPEPEEDAYYWSDLTGLEVVNLQGIALGEITGLFETGANDVMTVQGERERLIPFIHDVVKEVDIEGRKMLVDWDAEF